MATVIIQGDDVCRAFGIVCLAHSRPSTYLLLLPFIIITLPQVSGHSAFPWPLRGVIARETTSVLQSLLKGTRKTDLSKSTEFRVYRHYQKKIPAGK